jgi:hypothetical protein
MVPFWAMAMAANWAWVFSAVGLMLKTMPLPQWLSGFFCLQYIPKALRSADIGPTRRSVNLQIGSVVVTWNIIEGGGETVLFGLGMKPESTPPIILTQGRGKVDWVTVWFWDMKVNSTISPTAALIDGGV